MNERIRELAERADGVFIHKLLTGAKQYTFLEKDLEKFAELIVQECVELVEGYTKQRTHTTFYKAEEQIKQHFGVEE